MSRFDHVQQPVVLVVEDDENALRLRLRALRDEGCDPIGARSHEQALRHLRSERAIDLVLTDIHLGSAPDDKSGVALARHLKESYVGLPVAGYSAYFADDDLTGARRYFDRMWIKGRQDYRAFSDVIEYCHDRALEYQRARHQLEGHARLEARLNELAATIARLERESITPDRLVWTVILVVGGIIVPVAAVFEIVTR